MLTQAMALKDEIIRLRRDIHQHPELSFSGGAHGQNWWPIPLARSATPFHPHPGGTDGRGAWIGTGDGPTIPASAPTWAALPIIEAVDVPFKSINDGVDAPAAMRTRPCC
ncbi:MAG: hypothetical protein R2851_03835 [Caldilineaceae bacterium]